MDIQVASNFERALFEASGRDAEWVTEAMATFGRERSLTLPPPILAALRARYAAAAVGDEETLATIGRIHRETGRLVDPHTAVGLAVAARTPPMAGGAPVVVLSTAHPAKFPDAIYKATGLTPPLPPRLKALYENPESVSVLPARETAVRSFIEARLPPS
jgi:threonine synthase